MEKDGEKVSVISILIVWMMMCACFVGMLNFIEDVEASDNEVRISWSTIGNERPAIYGDRIAWHNGGSPGEDIFVYDLETDTEIQLTNEPETQWSARIHGDRIVWQDQRNFNDDIYLYDFSNETEMRITSDGGYQGYPDIYGDIIVWHDDRNGNLDIYMFNLINGTEMQITTDGLDQSYPVVYGDKIVWHDQRTGNYDLYMYNLTTFTEIAITNDADWQWYPAIYGDRIVWHDNRNGNWDIYMYEISTGIISPVTTDPGEQRFADIYKDRVVYHDFRNGNYDIYMYDISKGTETQVTTNLSWQFYPVIYDDIIVWQDERLSDKNIYMTHIDQDEDGVYDWDDAFPENPGEYLDTDSDGMGDNLDPDADNDGWDDDIEVQCASDPKDNLSLPSNFDGDPFPDAIDSDDDNDGVYDTVDAFPLDPNEWMDTDSDGTGDNTDMDIDGDGAENTMDAFPMNPNEWVDTDSDDIGNNLDLDDDNDGWSDDLEVVCGSDPLDFSSRPIDTDEDTIPDILDTDDDNDGIPDDYDASSLAQDDILWSKSNVDLGDYGIGFYGEVAGDRSGISIAGAGDVNGDGYDDILIGAYNNDEGGGEAGQTFLIFGKGSTWPTKINLSDADASFIGESGGDRSGSSIAGAGDVNGDGYDDFLIGAPYHGGNRGQTYVIYGKASGWSMDTDLSLADASFIGEGNADLAGDFVAGAGDVNGDGFDDILIGAYKNNEGGDDAGQTYLVFGNASGWSMGTSLSTANASFWGEAVQDRAGSALAGGGDVNGDGFDDILIGAFFNDEGGLDAGQTYLILGKASGWANDVNVSNSDASFYGEDVMDYSGSAGSISIAGDVNGDGYDDILIGAVGNDDGGGSSGQTYLILGKASGWTMDINLSSVDASFWGERGGDTSGKSVSSAGDVNGDGYDDIIIGAPHNDDGGNGAGKTYLVFGKAAGWVMDNDLSDADASFIGEDNDDQSGNQVAGAGDVNGDGSDNILIGAYQDEFGGDLAGQTYLIIRSSETQVQNVSLNLTTGMTGIHISWDDTYDEPYFFGIYRGTEPNLLYRLIDTNASTYTDINVTPGVTYYYAVVAIGPLGGESPLSVLQSIVADVDTDGDTIGDNLDLDDDNDGWSDDMEIQCGTEPLNVLSMPIDTDGDSTPDIFDNDDDGDNVNDDVEILCGSDPKDISSVPPDFDGDMVYDFYDTDDDDDGVPDHVDFFPYDSSKWMNPALDLINNTINDIQNRVTNIQLDIIGMNASLDNLHDSMYDLNQTLLNEINDLTQQLADANNSILSRIVDAETIIMENISSLNDTNIISYLEYLNDTLFSDIQNQLVSITDDIIAMDASVSDQLASLLDNITSDDGAFRAWLDLVLEAIDANLTATNNTLHTQLSDLDAYMAGFNDSIKNDIFGILDALTTHDQNTGQDHSDLQSQLDEILQDLGELELGELKSKLSNLAQNVSYFNESIAEDIWQVIQGIGYFEKNASHKLAAINSTLDDLAKLEQILTDLRNLDTELQNAVDELKTSIDNIPKEEKAEEEGFGLTELLLIIVLVLLIINLIMMLMGGRGKASNVKNIPEERVKSKPKKVDQEEPTEVFEETSEEPSEETNEEDMGDLLEELQDQY
ncbi:MAG: FG-GAP repeat protein [Thermoplasmata archaeon]|nr:MAG: FG-GAP repeat protein [Thermoplasmata archaeon]